jgi:hypothetical protein
VGVEMQCVLLVVVPGSLDTQGQGPCRLRYGGPQTCKAPHAALTHWPLRRDKKALERRLPGRDAAAQAASDGPGALNSVFKPHSARLTPSGT